jgi:arylsulfatase A-like enzyme
VLFENAISVGGNTTTAMAGVFTGRYPFFEYGASWTEPFGMERFRRDAMGPGLPGGMTTLAETLSAAGYQTAGFITNPYLKSVFGMQKGFAHYEELFDPARAAFLPAEQVLQRALRHLATLDWQRPTFVYLHLMDTHGPSREPQAATLGPLAEPLARNRDEWWRAWESLSSVGVGEHEPAREYMIAAYDSAVRHADDAVGRLLEEYDRRGLRENTLFVVMADHGEEFLEHGGTTHKGTLYEELVHVPLVVRAPGGLRGERWTRLVRNFDVAPTVLDYAGQLPPAGAMDARTLRPVLEGREFTGPQTAYAGFPALRMMRTERYKLLRLRDGSEQFFDLKQDPGEVFDLAQAERPDVQAARRTLGKAMDEIVAELASERPSAKAARPEMTVDEETRRQLDALGYVQ